MSVSRHPVALSLERQVGGATRLLATVMALPLIDGIFPALVIAGALNGLTGILETGLLIFGGSATVAVILAEMDGTPREQARAVLMVGAVLLPVAAAEAVLAPAIASLIDLAIFERFAGLVILAVAAKTASSKVGEYLPRPAVIIGLGLVASVRPAGAQLMIAVDPSLVARATAAAGVGVAFALAVALLGHRLRGAVDIDRFRFGSSVALAMLALSVLGLMPTEAPVALGVLAVTAAFAFDPNASDRRVDDDGDPVPADAEVRGGRILDSESSPVADGGRNSDGDRDSDAGDDRESDADRDVYRESRYGSAPEEESRAPWM